MAFTLSLDSRAPVDAVLAAIREDTREWRESALPGDVRSLGHLQVQARIKEHRFTLGYQSTRFEHTPIELMGVVTAVGQGSRVDASCGRPAWWIVPSALGGFGVIILASGGGSGSFLPLAAAAAVGLWLRSRHLVVSREDNLEARYLAERLQRAVASASQAAG
jgi:hypothetical protein